MSPRPSSPVYPSMLSSSPIFRSMSFGSGVGVLSPPRLRRESTNVLGDTVYLGVDDGVAGMSFSGVRPRPHPLLPEDLDLDLDLEDEGSDGRRGASSDVDIGSDSSVGSGGVMDENVRDNGGPDPSSENSVSSSGSSTSSSSSSSSGANLHLRDAYVPRPSILPPRVPITRLSGLRVMERSRVSMYRLLSMSHGYCVRLLHHLRMLMKDGMEIGFLSTLQRTCPPSGVGHGVAPFMSYSFVDGGNVSDVDMSELERPCDWFTLLSNFGDLQDSLRDALSRHMRLMEKFGSVYYDVFTGELSAEDLFGDKPYDLTSLDVSSFAHSRSDWCSALSQFRSDAERVSGFALYSSDSDVSSLVEDLRSFLLERARGVTGLSVGMPVSPLRLPPARGTVRSREDREEDGGGGGGGRAGGAPVGARGGDARVSTDPGDQLWYRFVIRLEHEVTSGYLSAASTAVGGVWGVRDSETLDAAFGVLSGSIDRSPMLENALLQCFADRVCGNFMASSSIDTEHLRTWFESVLEQVPKRQAERLKVETLELVDESNPDSTGSAVGYG